MFRRSQLPRALLQLPNTMVLDFQLHFSARFPLLVLNRKFLQPSASRALGSNCRVLSNPLGSSLNKRTQLTWWQLDAKLNWLRSSGTLRRSPVAYTSTMPKRGSSSDPTQSQASVSTLDERFKNQPVNMSPSEFIQDAVRTHRVVVFSKSSCSFCSNARALLSSLKIPNYVINLDWYGEFGQSVQNELLDRTGRTTVPNIFVSGTSIGGFTDLQELVNRNALEALLQQQPAPVAPPQTDPEYDLVVVGGGSGGIAAAKEAAILGLRVLVCDYVSPSPVGTTWGIGGTCVNVGCIPKKLMHQASLINDMLQEAPYYGYEACDKVSHTWKTMVDNIQNYISSLNWSIRVDLKKLNIAYYNAKASFVDLHTIQLDRIKQDPITVTGKKFLIAVGGRPHYPDFPGAREHCITSDDIFSLQKPPGKTLIIGASYISLECAGFLNGLGYPVEVMVRSKVLRTFDSDVVGYLEKYMEKIGIKFIKGCVPTGVTLRDSAHGHSKNVKGSFADGSIFSDYYETVVLAVGRDPNTKELNLEKINLDTKPDSGKIITKSITPETKIKNIFAVGDVVEGNKELTPVAIKSGQLVARSVRGKETNWVDLRYVPTTVFTPLEYACVGYTEEEANAELKPENLEIFHTQFVPLETAMSKSLFGFCYTKIICKNIPEKNYPVIGLHILGPNAGEMIQGFALAIKMGATKAHFDDLIGVHPTCAETLTSVRVTKRSGKPIQPGAC